MLPFEVATGDGRRIGKIWYRDLDRGLESRPIKSVELLAMLLDRARRQASAYLGESVHEASISVPALFDHERRREVSDAAEIAGLKVLSLTTDPCGLILAAMVPLQILRTETNVLALDVGASYSNVALATLAGGIVEIKAVGSDMVGGNDFDHALFQHLARLAEKRGMNPLKSKRATHRLCLASEVVKIVLSLSEKHTVALESLIGDQDFFETITRETFESLCMSLFQTTIWTVDMTAAQSSNQKFGISYVLIGGESSRIPKLQELWKQRFAHSTIKFINIGHAGAMGLALQAGIIAGRDLQTHPIRDLLLLEVAKDNIGIETRGGIMSKLISRNSRVPTIRREKFWWHTEDACPEVPAPVAGAEQTRPLQSIPSHGALQIYEGHQTRTKDNRRIGTISLMPLFALVPNANFVLEVEICMDQRHTIYVEVSIAGTQARISKKMDTAGALRRTEMQTLKRYAQEFERSDEVEAARVEGRCDLDGQIAKCQGLLDAVSADVDPTLVESVMSTRAWAENRPDARLSHFVARQRKLDRVESKIRRWWEAKTAGGMEARSSDAIQGSGLPDSDNLALGSRAPQPVRPDPSEVTSSKSAEARADEGQAAVVTQADDTDATVRPSSIPKKDEAPKGEDDARTGASGDAKGEFTTEKPGFKSAVPEVVVVSGPAASTLGRELEPNRASGVSAKHESMTVDSGVGGLEESAKRQPRPQSADEGEAETSVRGTTLPSGTELATVGSSGLDAFFSSTSMVCGFTDADFNRMSAYLRNTGSVAWSTAPRLYTVLRVIDQLDAMEVFLRQGINDMWFPFTNSTLPAAPQPSIQAQFLDRQEMAYSQSKSFQLESGEQKHAYFSRDDPLPFRVIARLGRGAQGSVDKVMSNFSQREYARKLFRKSRGLRAEDVQTFKTELGILKRVTHRHCVSLVGTPLSRREGLAADADADCNIF